MMHTKTRISILLDWIKYVSNKPGLFWHKYNKNNEKIYLQNNYNIRKTYR